MRVGLVQVTRRFLATRTLGATILLLGVACNARVTADRTAPAPINPDGPTVEREGEAGSSVGRANVIEAAAGMVAGDRQVVVRYPAETCERENSGPQRVEILVSENSPRTFSVEVGSSPLVCSGGGLRLEKGDFNFDGHEDFAVPLDRTGPYGSETYAVFVFDPSKGSYIEAPQLATLTHDFIGMFRADAKRRRLVASSLRRRVGAAST
jgi:hypothetical protein